MLKPLVAATALAALAGTSLVYAQGFGGHDRFGDHGPRAETWHRPSAADLHAFGDARIAALKAGLELTPDQAKNWPPFEQALHDMVDLRVQRIESRQSGNEQPPASPFERLSHRADAMTKAGTALKKVADAGAPLYASLNDDQKARFVKLARILRPHPHMGRHGDHGWNRDGHRFGQNDDGGQQKSEL